MASPSLPVIDIAPLLRGERDRIVVAEAMGEACSETGFFYIAGHGVDEGLQRGLERASRRFFACEHEHKMLISMARGGGAWRGYFPVGGELTSGKADLKEGVYFGEELGPGDPRVRDGWPLHGANLFPDDIPELRAMVLSYMQSMTRLGHALMRGLSRSLGLDEKYFAEHYTGRPFLLFRIFHYPPAPFDEGWGVGEHTDYGVLTILKQDDCGGLEVKSPSGWIAAPPIPGTFVCNIGDMLERLTAGLYRSTPHRVCNRSGKGRLSFPFFFDPAFDAPVRSLPTAGRSPAREAAGSRWDGASVHDFQGNYGDYLVSKVKKVFPALGKRVLR